MAKTPLVSHADLLQHATGCRIAREVHCVHAMESEFLEPMFHHRPCRLGRISATPIRQTDPVADLRAIVIGFRMQTDCADERVVQCDGKGVISALDRGVMRRDPSLRFAIGVRMRNEERVQRDLARAGELLHERRVLQPEAAQHQAWRGNHRGILCSPLGLPMNDVSGSYPRSGG